MIMSGAQEGGSAVGCMPQGQAYNWQGGKGERHGELSKSWRQVGMYIYT